MFNSKPRALEELVAFLELNDSVGLVMPRVFYPDGSPQKLCKRLPVPFDMLSRRTFPGVLKRFCHSRMGLFELSNINTNTCALGALSIRLFHVAAQEVAAGMWSLRRTILHVLRRCRFDQTHS